MKKSIFFVYFLILFAALSFGCPGKKEKNNQNISIKTGEENMVIKEIIWTTMNVWMKADPGRGKMGSYEVTKFAFIGYDYVKNCPAEIKVIIAFFSKLYVTEEERGLAEALGNYSSLKEAQEQLLKDKEHIFKDIGKENYGLGLLEIKIEKDIVYVTLQSHNFGNFYGTYKFRIHENGDIKYLNSIVN